MRSFSSVQYNLLINHHDKPDYVGSMLHVYGDRHARHCFMIFMAFVLGTIRAYINPPLSPWIYNLYYLITYSNLSAEKVTGIVHYYRLSGITTWLG